MVNTRGLPRQCTGYLDNIASAESRGSIRRLVSSGVKRSEQKRTKLAIPTKYVLYLTHMNMYSGAFCVPILVRTQHSMS